MGCRGFNHQLAAKRSFVRLPPTTSIDVRVRRLKKKVAVKRSLVSRQDDKL